MALGCLIAGSNATHWRQIFAAWCAFVDRNVARPLRCFGIGWRVGTNSEQFGARLKPLWSWCLAGFRSAMLCVRFWLVSVVVVWCFVSCLMFVVWVFVVSFWCLVFVVCCCFSVVIVGCCLTVLFAVFLVCLGCSAFWVLFLCCCWLFLVLSFVFLPWVFIFLCYFDVTVLVVCCLMGAVKIARVRGLDCVVWWLVIFRLVLLSDVC